MSSCCSFSVPPPTPRGKLPHIELIWLRFQRDKIREKSHIVMSSSDRMEKKKLDKKEQGRLRKLKLKERENEQKKFCEEEYLKVKYQQ